MVARRVKAKDHEDLSDSNIKRVSEMLEEKSINKKQACEMLKISYNTTRLDKIITQFHADQEYKKKRREMNRGKPASQMELQEIARSTLQGDSIQEISKRLFRSPVFVKNCLERLGIPDKPKGEERIKPTLLPELCVSEDFVPGEIAWSAVYHAPCIIKQEIKPGHGLPGLSNRDYEKTYGSKLYAVYILEKMDSEGTYFSHVTSGGFNAYSLAYDLGKLSHLQNLGVNLERLNV